MDQLILQLPIKVRTDDQSVVITDATGCDYFFFYDKDRKLKYDGWCSLLISPEDVNKNEKVFEVLQKAKKDFDL